MLILYFVYTTTAIIEEK